MHKNPTAEVTAYDLATKAGMTPARVGNCLSDLATDGAIVRLHPRPTPGYREPARYRLAQEQEEVAS
jgi:hypothetical protein